MLSTFESFLLLLDFPLGGTKAATGIIGTERFKSIGGFGETMGAPEIICNLLTLASVEVLFKLRLLFKGLSDGIATGRERNHISRGSLSINICNMTQDAVMMAPTKNIFFQSILYPPKSRINSFIRITARLSHKVFISSYYKISTSPTYKKVNPQQP